MFANIIVDITHEKLDKIFQYKVPPRWKGNFLLVWKCWFPLGGKQNDKGICDGFCEHCAYDLSKVKEIAEISREGIVIETKLIALAAWMKEQYGGTMIQALKTVLPIKQKENARVKSMCVSFWMKKRERDSSLLSGQKSEGESEAFGRTSGYPGS